MEKQTIFKTSAFGGFEKKAVLDYIYKLNEDAEATQVQLKEKLDVVSEEHRVLTGELGQANERIRAMQQSLDSVNAELVGERARTVELGNLGEGLREELERERERLRERERELEKLSAENRELSATNDEFAAKRDEVNESVARIGQLMLGARSDADEMIKNAEAEAARLDAQAKQQADSILREAEAKAAAMLEDAELRSGGMIRSAEERSTLMLASAKARSDTAIDNSRQSIDTVFDRMQGFQTEVDQIRSLLSHMFQQVKGQADEVDDSIEDAFTVLSGARDKLLKEESAEADAPAEDTEDTAEGAAPDSFFRGAAEA